jgi:hypothetical protein
MRIDVGTAQTLENLAAYLPRISQVEYERGANPAEPEHETK